MGDDMCVYFDKIYGKWLLEYNDELKKFFQEWY